MRSGSGEGQAETKSCHCLCKQHGKNTDEKHLKILNRSITKNYPALKSKPCIRRIIPANQGEGLRGDLTTESMLGFYFANKAKLRYNRFSRTRTTCIAGQYEESLSDMADGCVFFLNLASYR